MKKLALLLAALVALTVVPVSSASAADTPPRLPVPFPEGYWTPEVSTVFDHFWANKDNLLTGWAAAWKLVAQHYRNQPYSMGYDLFNEPWAGIEWPSCLTTGCAASYSSELQPA